MKTSLILILSLLFINNNYSTKDLPEIRAYYYQVCLKKSTVEEYNVFLNNCKNDNQIELKGYKAVAWFLYAEYYNNPVKKWNCFIQGKEDLEQLIVENPDNLELRFLRLTIQDNLPEFLGYSSNKGKDTEFLKKRLNSVSDQDLKTRIINYLSDHKISKM